jgi:hypothetical protein
MAKRKPTSRDLMKTNPGDLSGQDRPLFGQNFSEDQHKGALSPQEMDQSRDIADSEEQEAEEKSFTSKQKMDSRERPGSGGIRTSNPFQSKRPTT